MAFFQGKKRINKMYLLALIFVLTLGLVGCTNKSSKVPPKTSANNTKSPIKYAVKIPQSGAPVTGEFEISGWAASIKGIKKVEILYKDESLLEEVQLGAVSPDYAREVASYSKEQVSGFKYFLDSQSFVNADQMVKVRFTGNDGAIEIAELKFKVDNPYSTDVYIEDATGPNDPKIKKTTDKAKQIVGEVIRPGMTEYQKVKTLHDYIITHAKYDEANWDRRTVTETDHSAYGILIEGTGTGTGYANAMALLLDTAGIENVVVHGETKVDGMWDTNSWNLVKVGGKYYHINVNWDDPDSNPDDLVSYPYFMLTDKQISRDHRWDKNGYPESSFTKYNSKNQNSTI